MLQEVVNILTKNNFFEGKNVYAYQKKNKNAPQVLLLLIEQMSEAIASGKYGVVLLIESGETEPSTSWY